MRGGSWKLSLEFAKYRNEFIKKRKNYNLFDDDDERRKLGWQNANSSCVVGIKCMTCGPLICLNHGCLSLSLFFFSFLMNKSEKCLHF